MQASHLFSKTRIWQLWLLSSIAILGWQASIVPYGDLPDKVRLGEMLFNDERLSRDGTISCASCHLPQFAFADTLALSKGVGGKLGTRNTPALTNLSARPLLFYDGRANSLEHQVHFPVVNSLEMDFSLPKPSSACVVLPTTAAISKPYTGTHPTPRRLSMLLPLSSAP
ncbi:MAG: cytochrome-c peroxidase [Sphingobacteriales bacterium]|nr:cytochrome-c peroxidase [Sphingobacteriales bacterium]